MPAIFTSTPIRAKPCVRLALLLCATLCLPACDRPRTAPQAAAPAAAPAAGPATAESAAVAPESSVPGKSGVSRPILQSILAPVSAPVASRAGGLAGGTAILPGLTDESCLGLTGAALDECLLAELASEPAAGESPAMREFREAQRERDQALLREEAQAMGADDAPYRALEADQGTEADPIDADEAYARERDAQWERERARLEQEEYLQESVQEEFPDDLPPEDFGP